MPRTVDPPRPCRRAALAAALLAGVAGCREAADQKKPPEKATPAVTLTCPSRGVLRWTVRQPADVEAFEVTAIVPKVAGYVESWKVDIGDRVKKGDTLAVLWVPDLVKEASQREAEVDQSRKFFAVADAHIASASAAVDEARAGLKRTEADQNYRRLQHRRVNTLLERSVVNKQVEEESRNELQGAEATVREAQARVERAEADLREGRAARDKAGVDVDVARAALERAKVMVAYATLAAPFDGVVTRRNVSTGDYVQPPGGQQSEPLYVVERRDTVRVFVDVPEADAVWVTDGSLVRIEVPALRGRDFEGIVRRSSYALKPRSRTLGAEVDLPNPDDLLRPGMYAYASVRVERRNVLSLPEAAVARQGDVNEGYREFCYFLDGGKVRKVAVETGSRGGGRVEVVRKQAGKRWEDFDGREPVVAGRISSLADGQSVTVRSEPAAPPRAQGPEKRLDPGATAGGPAPIQDHAFDP